MTAADFSLEGRALQVGTNVFYNAVVPVDEVCAAVSCGFLSESELLAFLDGKPDNLEVVLTGRNPSEALQARADYITEMVKRRHPFDKGIGARKGIEL